MKIIKYLFLLFFIISVISSCDDNICTSDTESLLSTKFNINDAEFLNNMSIYAPEWTDSIHYNEEGENNTLNFALSPEDSVTTIIITSSTEVLKDTIQIFHQNELFFLSDECGFIMLYEIDSLLSTTYLIDSAFIVESKITNDDNGHIQIYL